MNLKKVDFYLDWPGSKKHYSFEKINNWKSDEKRGSYKMVYCRY